MEGMVEGMIEGMGISDTLVDAGLITVEAG